MKNTLILSSILFFFLAIGIYQFKHSNNKPDKEKITAFEEKKERKAASFKGSLEWRNELLRNVETGEINSEDYYKAVKYANNQKSEISNKSGGILNLEWVNRGPDSQAGRTRTVLFDKDDPNLIFAGGSSGGLYKTTDNADNWERVTGYNGNNAAVMSLAQSVNGTLFVGTGEFIVSPPGFNPDGELYRSNFTGDGMYKSSDKGLTWSHIDATNVNATLETSAGGTIPTFNDDWAIVSTLSAHPLNSNLLLAGTKVGLQISTDAEASQPSFNTISSAVGVVSDVKFTSDGKEAWAAINGSLYYSSDLSNNFNSWSSNSPSISGATRSQIAISNVDENGEYIIYASMTDFPGCLLGIFKSEDKGSNWTQIAYAGGLDPFAQPTGDGTTGCQGWYDHCIAVNPVDKNKIYIGGISFYTWGSGSGGLKRADQIDSEFAESLDPNYIHADKHTIAFNPHDVNGNTMLIGHDGGMSMCLNANSGFPDNLVYSENNKNYITLQCYSVGSGKYGEVMAGAQDNGTQYVNYKGTSPKAAIEVSGGDGVGGAEISNFDLDINFSGYVYGALYRSFNNGESYTNFLDANIDPADCGHITCTDLIGPETCADKEEEGQNFIYPFYLMETYDRLLPRHNIYIKAKKEDILLPGGTINEIRETIPAGDVTDKVEIEKIPGMDFNGLGLNYSLTYDLEPGKIDSFPNPFDAKYFVPTKCGTNFFVCTNPLQKGTAPRFSSVTIPQQSSIARMDASNDGDMLVGVGANRIIIMQGWDAYDPDINPSSVTYETVNLSSIGGINIVGVSVDKNDKNHVLVTEAGYGGVTKVFVSYNAATDTPTFNLIHNNLPEMPIYCCVIDKANPQRYILGTELGIWSSNDGGANWFEENDGMGGRFPIYALRQEWMNNFDCNVISAGTFGAGMFTCSSLTECANKNDLIWGRPDDVTPINDLAENELKIFPNPVQGIAKIQFELNTKKNIDLQVYSITGQLVYDNNLGQKNGGVEEIDIDFSGLSNGTYFAVIKDKSSVLAKAKLIKK